MGILWRHRKSLNPVQGDRETPMRSLSFPVQGDREIPMRSLSLPGTAEAQDPRRDEVEQEFEEFLRERWPGDPFQTRQHLTHKPLDEEWSCFLRRKSLEQSKLLLL